MDPRLVTAIIVVVGVPAVLFGYIILTEQILRPVPDRRRATPAGRGCGCCRLCHSWRSS